MNPETLHKLAKESPSKFGLEAYRYAICELRRKGNSWREIADFLIEKGVKTDHARVYRLMMEGNPLFDHDDQPLIMGDQTYESQEGKPLRPYEQGLFISIKKKLRLILLEHPEKILSAWCQCQFQLSNIPNRIWLKQLHNELHAEFNLDHPGHLQSQLGFELKFEGDVMALDCYAFDPKQHYKEICGAIERTTNFFREDKSRWTNLRQMQSAREEKILKLYYRTTETTDEIMEEHEEDYADKEKRLKKDFDAL